MPSTFQTFPTNYELVAGDIQKLPTSVDVIVYDADTDTDNIATLNPNSDGEVEATTLSVPVGTLVHFRVENYLGMAFSVSQITI